MAVELSEDAVNGMLSVISRGSWNFNITEMAALFRLREELMSSLTKKRGSGISTSLLELETVSEPDEPEDTSP